MQNRAQSTKNHGKSYGKSTKNQGLTFLKLAKSAMKFSILGLFMQQKSHAERIILNHEAQIQEFLPPQPQNPALQQFSEHALFQESHEFLQQDQIWQDSNNLGGNIDHVDSHGEQFSSALHNPDINLHNHRRQITSIDTQYDGEISVTSAHAFQTTQLTDPTEYLAEPFIEKLPDGTFIVAWRTYRDDKYRILLQQFDENHNKVDEEIEVISDEDSTLKLGSFEIINNNEVIVHSNTVSYNQTYSKINLKTKVIHSSTPLYCGGSTILHLQDGNHVILCSYSNSSSHFAYLHKLDPTLHTITQTKVSPADCNGYSHCFFYSDYLAELIDGSIAFAYGKSGDGAIYKYSASLSFIKSVNIENGFYINYLSQLQNQNILLSCSQSNSYHSNPWYIYIYNSNLSRIANYDIISLRSNYITPYYQLKDKSVLIAHLIDIDLYTIQQYSSTNLTPLSTALENLGSWPTIHQLLSEEILLTYEINNTHYAHKFDSSFESLIKVELFSKDRIYPPKMQELSDGRLVFAFHTYATSAYLQFRDADLTLIDSISLGTGEIKHMHLMSNNNPMIVYETGGLNASSYLGQTTSTLKYQRYATFYDLEPLALAAITSSSREIGSIKYMLELLQNGVQPDGEDGEAKYDGEDSEYGEDGKNGADSATKSDGEFDENIVYDKNAPKIAQHEFLPAEMSYYPGVTILNGVLKVEMSPFSANALLRQVEINMNMYTQSFILRHVLIDPTQKNNIVEGITKVTYGCFDKSADLLRCEQPVIVDDGEDGEAKYDGEDGEDGEARHDGEDGEDGEAKSDIKTKPDGEDKKGRGTTQNSKTQPEVEGFSSEATAAIAVGTAVGVGAIATIIASKVAKKAAAKAIQKVASDKNAKQAKTDKENEDQKDLELNNGQRDAQMEGQGENARDGHNPGENIGDGNNFDENNNRLDTQNMHSQVELRQDFSTNNLSSMNIGEAGNIKEKTAKDNAAQSHEMQSNAAQSGGKKTTINLRPQQNFASELRDGLRDQLQDEMMEKMHRENALPAIIGATVFLAGKQLSKEKVHEELQVSIFRIINGRMDKLFYTIAPKLKTLLKEERAASKHHDGEQNSRKDGDLQVIGASEGDSSSSYSDNDDDMMQTLQNAKLQTGHTDMHENQGVKNSMGATLTRKKQAERVRTSKNPQNSFKNDFNSPQDITVTEPDNFSFSVNFEQSFEQGHNASSLESCDHSSDRSNSNSKVDSQQHFNSTGCKTQPKTSNTSLSPTHAMQKQQSSQSQYFDSQNSKNPSSKIQPRPQAINMKNLTETFIKNALALLHHKEVPGAAQIHTLDPDNMHEQLANIRKNVKFIDHCNGNKCYEITQIQGVQAASLLMNYMMHNLALNENLPATEKAKNYTPQVEETLYNALLREKNNNQMEYAAK